jgi:catalase
MKIKTITSTIFALGLMSCSSNDIRVPASVSVEQPPVEQGEIWTEKEASNVATVARVFKETLIESTGDSPLMRRDAHPKHHGCVKADLKISNTFLPKKLRVGLFENNKKYKTVVRFSNGDPDFTKHDADADVRGMAVKILDVPYQNYLQQIGVESGRSDHDFVFMNAEEFFIPNPEQYEKFMKSTKGRFGVVGYLLTHWGTLGNILKARKKVGNPLEVSYASATPYKLGSKSMKMKFKSCQKAVSKVPKNGANDFLGRRLESSLSKDAACFDFYVQINKDPKKNNIENAMKKWDKKKSPYYRVGRLTVDKQSGFRTASRMKACENMTFNPWRAHPENRPMGGVNRVRLEVYLKQSELRHNHNGIK